MAETRMDKGFPEGSQEMLGMLCFSRTLPGILKTLSIGVLDPLYSCVSAAFKAAYLAGERLLK